MQANDFAAASTEDQEVENGASHISSCFVWLIVLNLFGKAKTVPKKKRLDMLRWLAAYQCFALAADATEVTFVYLVHVSFFRNASAGLEVCFCHGTSACLHAHCWCNNSSRLVSFLPRCVVVVIS